MFLDENIGQYFRFMYENVCYDEYYHPMTFFFWPYLMETQKNPDDLNIDTKIKLFSFFPKTSLPINYILWNYGIGTNTIENRNDTLWSKIWSHWLWRSFLRQGRRVHPPWTARSIHKKGVPRLFTGWSMTWPMHISFPRQLVLSLDAAATKGAS